MLLNYSSEENWRAYLGTSAPIRFAVTINLSPKVLVPAINAKGRKVKVQYGLLRPQQQRQALIEYIEKVYKPECDACHFVFELCKSGEVHAHGIVCIEDDKKRCMYWLSDLRKSVGQNQTALSIHKRQSHIRIANHIVYNDMPREWEEYLLKDVGNHLLEPIYLIPTM